MSSFILAQFILTHICSASINSTLPQNETVAIVLEHLEPEVHHSTPSDYGLHHWQHGLLMFTSFGAILPISMILFYFGGTCSMSIQKRKQIHYFGYILSFIICGFSILFELLILKGVRFDTNHGILGMTLFLVMFVSMCVFGIMRMFKYGLQIWCDFILCFLLLCWGFYEMLNGLLIETNNITHAMYYLYGLMTWFSVMTISIVTLAIYVYLTTGINMVIVQEFGQKESFDLHLSSLAKSDLEVSTSDTTESNESDYCD